MLTEIGEIKIIDDFLSEEDFLTIKDTLMAPHFPWYASIVVNPEHSTDELNNVQFVHEFYKYMKPLSKVFDTFGCVLEKINPVALLRVKANFVTRTENIFEHGMHTDVPEYVDGMRTGILYMNTCNGYTRFDDEDDTQVQSVANRFVHFPAYIRHTGTTTTDEKCRVVINFNYLYADTWTTL
ncbi:DNA endonuclease V [Synechococcus phage S-RS29]|nr:DNA endonuclease V [Synechococcus phage S-RS29]